VILALAATSIFNIGMGLQKKGAGAFGGGLKAMLRPDRRGDLAWWMCGSAVMLPALLLQIAALRTGTATLVAIVDGFGLVILTLFSALILGEVIGDLEVLGLLLTIMGVGVGGYVQVHLPDTSTVHWAALGAGAGALLCLSLGGAAWRWRESQAYGVWLGLAAGFLAGFAVLTIRLGFVLDAQTRAACVWGVLTLACFVLNQIAYQQGRAVEVVPAFTGAAILGPILLGPLGLGEVVTGLTGVAVLLLVAGLAAVAWAQIREENNRHYGVIAVTRRS
jgi:drug/metabolite transporter (DMT)-like permease